MEERISAKMFLDYIFSEKGIKLEDIHIGDMLVGSWMKSVIDDLVKKTGAALVENWVGGSNYPLYTADFDGNKVSFSVFPVGGPATSIMMEEFIAAGVKSFIGIGMAGSLQKSAPVGSLIVPNSCIALQGTALHYLEAERVDVAVPDPRLVEVVKQAAKETENELIFGPIWTNDAFFRELNVTIDSYQKQGVLGVDMETATMYAIGVFRMAEVCNILAVSDELWDNWNPQFNSPELKNAMDRIVDIVYKAIGINKNVKIGI